MTETALSARRCPRCGPALLEPAHEHGAEIDACTRCGGLWFEAGELAKAIRAHDPEALSSATVAGSLGVQLEVSEHICPGCRIRLHRWELSERNPTPVELCESCFGVWLERDQLVAAQAGHQLEQARSALDAPRSWGNWFFQFIGGLPVEFNVAPRRTPFVTYALILACAVIYPLYWPTFRWLNHLILPLEFALYPDRIGQLDWFASLVTSQFLHAGLIHLAGNMYFLWILGDNVEDLLGHWRFLLFYLAAGVVAGVAFSAFHYPSTTPCLGASGAISGVLGTYAVLFRRSRLTFMLVVWQFKLRVWAYVAIWALFNLGGWLVESPGVAWEAHLGGLAFGLLFGAVSYRALLRRRPLLRLINDVRA